MPIHVAQNLANGHCYRLSSNSFDLSCDSFDQPDHQNRQPRPDIPEMIKYYKPWEMKKFKVKPGITGLTQINGRGLLNFQETLSRDVEYVETRSFWNNFKIILETIKVTFLRIGAF